MKKAIIAASAAAVLGAYLLAEIQRPIFGIDQPALQIISTQDPFKEQTLEVMIDNVEPFHNTRQEEMGRLFYVSHNANKMLIPFLYAAGFMEESGEEIKRVRSYTAGNSFQVQGIVYPQAVLPASIGENQETKVGKYIQFSAQIKRINLILLDKKEFGKTMFVDYQGNEVRAHLFHLNDLLGDNPAQNVLELSKIRSGQPISLSGYLYGKDFYITSINRKGFF